jgi:hypothetical protein
MLAFLRMAYSFVLRVLVVALVLFGLSELPARAQEPKSPWRLNSAWGGPSWLKLSGRQRTRFESMHGQQRPSKPFNDDQWFLRTSLRGDVDFDSLGGTLELMDSRAYGGGADAFATTAFTNTTDIIQANAVIKLGQLGTGEQRLLLGRYTMSLGSRRFVIRNGYRNTVNTFTGVDYLWKNEGGAQVRAFWTMPVRRRPFDPASLRDNDFAWDDQDLDRQFSGLFTSRKITERTSLEAFVYGKHNDDDGAAKIDIYTPGFRIHRPSKSGEYFGQFEVAGQFGKSQFSAGDMMLDHEAMFAHASIGYTFDHDKKPSIRLAYDYASGDSDPNDGENNRFDRLYGAPRFEYCPTGLYGFVQRSNINTPELRFSMKPTEKTWVMVAYRNLRLAAARDQWMANKVRDASGAAGRDIGQQIELRARFDVVPGNMFVETGGAYLFAGEFLDKAPNSRGGRDTRYCYVEMIWIF